GRKSQKRPASVAGKKPNGKSQMKLGTGHGIRLLLVLGAIALTTVRLPARWVERYYSTGVYPQLAAAVKHLTRRLPVPMLDVLLILAAVGVLAWWVWKIRNA